MSYEVKNGTIGMTGTSLCVTIPRSYTASESLEHKQPLKKIMRKGFMVIVFKDVGDGRMHDIVKYIDKKLGERKKENVRS